MSTWSYQVLCDDDGMETFYELNASNDLAGDIEKKLDKFKAYADYRTSVEAYVAAALVSYCLADTRSSDLTDIDRDDPEQNEKFENEYIPFLDRVYDTDLSALVDKAIKVLHSLPNTELGEYWHDEELSIEWIETVSRMEYALKAYKVGRRLEKRRKAAGIYSYEVLASKDAMKTFKQLEKSDDLENDIRQLLYAVNKNSDHHECTAGLVAAGLVAFSEAEGIDYNHIIELDLDDPDERAKFDKEYDVFLDKVFDTDLSKLMKKSSKVLQRLFDSKLGELWKAYDEAWHDWADNLDDMIGALEKTIKDREE